MIITMNTANRTKIQHIATATIALLLMKMFTCFALGRFLPFGYLASACFLPFLLETRTIYSLNSQIYFYFIFFPFFCSGGVGVGGRGVSGVDGCFSNHFIYCHQMRVCECVCVCGWIPFEAVLGRPTLKLFLI